MRLTLVIFIFVQCFSSVAQTASDTISIKYRGFFGGYEYSLNGEILSSDEVSSKLDSVPETEKLIRASNRYDIWGTIFAVGGGLLVGGEIGRSLRGAEVRQANLYSGIGLVIAAFIFGDISEKRFRNAVVLYNDNVSNRTSWLRSSELYVTPNANGVGLVWRF